VFRIGKPLDNLQIILKSDSVKDEIERSLVVGKAFGFGGWLTLDMFQWLNSSGVIEMSPEWAAFVNRNAPRLWLFGLLSSLSMNLYRIHRLHPNCLKSKEEAKALICKSATDTATCQAAKDAIQDAADLVIPLSLMEAVDLSPGVVGMVGTFTSILGITTLMK
jgi:peroxin-11B